MRATRGLLAAGVLSLAACATSAQAPRQQVPSDVVATVGSTTVTLADLDKRALERPAEDFGSMRLSQAIYQARRSALDAIVGNLLIEAEARARGIDPAQLVEREISSKVSTPTDADITAWYRDNPARVQGAALDQVRAPIRALLLEERTRAVRRSFVETLKVKTAVKITLEPVRENVADAGRPSRGPANARVEIIEFADFQCPFCLRSYPVVARVLSAYGDRVRLVYRHFPLSSHPNARPAAEAAACAAEQGKFWEYYNRLFTNQDKLTDADLKGHAIAVGLDTAKFGSCFDARKYSKDIDADIAAGSEVGVSGTPAFFINGRPLDGAQPFEAFKEVIDEELAR